jgi:Ca2+-binding EF-hand superfamily protein
MVRICITVRVCDTSGGINFETFCEVLEYKLTESGHLDLILASFDEFKGTNGLIGLKDLQRVAISIGEDMSIEELQQMIEQADEDGDGFVSRDEFIKLLSD